MGGAQDNGTYKVNNYNSARINGGDGMDCEVNYMDANVIYSSSQYGNFDRSDDGGLTDVMIFEGIGQGSWVTPMQIDPNVPTTVYAGTADLWKSTNKGQTETQISNFTNMNLLRIVEVASSNSNIIYVSDGIRIRKTINGGNTWQAVGASLPANYISSIEIHHTNPNIIWVALSGYTAGQKIYKSIDGGVNWVNISGTLPNFPANTIVHHDGSLNDEIYIGMDVGVYVLNNNSGTNWQAFLTDLPNVTISELEIPYGSNVIRAATFGRGVWESPTNSTIAVPPIAQAFADDNVICPGGNVVFNNASIEYDSLSWMFPGGNPTTSTALNPVVNYAVAGSYDVTIIASNTVGVDTFILSNYIVVDADTMSLDVQEAFSAGVFPTDWKIDNPDEGKTWEMLSNLGAFGNDTGCIYIDNFDYSGDNLDYFYTPAVDLSQYAGTTLSFDVAYTTYSANSTDTMAVYYSVDCGVTLNKIWEKGALDLSTTGAASTSPFTPTPTEWRTETINISGLTGLETKFYFENRGHYGNNLYVDNINILGTLITNINVKTVALPLVNVYPNPGKYTLHIDVEGLENHTIVIYDFSGKQVLERSKAKTKEVFNIRTLSAGMYNVKIISEQGVLNKKFVKN